MKRSQVRKKKRAAIAVYVESGWPVAVSSRFGGRGKFVLEFNQFLHNSLMVSGAYKEFDIVAFGEQRTLDQLNDEHVVKVPVWPDPYWDAQRYQFGKSIALATERYHYDLLSRYEFLLRSDTDVFVTPHILDLVASPIEKGEVHCGRGGYGHGDVAVKIRDFVARNYRIEFPTHRGNIGSTIYGRSDDVLNILGQTESALRTLLDNDFRYNEGSWADGWYRGVASMYANEIAVNYWAKAIHQDKWLLDCHSDQVTPIEGNQAHIHCWHTDRMFSKFWWYNGRYDGFRQADPAQSMADYCMANAMRGDPR